MYEEVSAYTSNDPICSTVFISGNWCDSSRFAPHVHEETWMIKFENSVVINRPVEEVFAFVVDFEKWPMWVSEMVEAKITSEGPVGLGTTVLNVVHILGRRIEATQEIHQYEPNRMLGFKSTSGPVSNDVTFGFESVDGGTELSVDLEADASGFFKLAEPLLARRIQRQWDSNLANLKDLMEAQA